jgi:hypothetical protein
MDKESFIPSSKKGEYQKWVEEFPECASYIFTMFLCHSEKIKPDDITFFKKHGVSIYEKNSYYPTKTGYSNAIQFACQNLDYDKMRVLLEANADPNEPIGLNPECCRCTSALDVLILKVIVSPDKGALEKEEKCLELLVKHGVTCELSEYALDEWKKNVKESDMNPDSFIKVFMGCVEPRKPMKRIL